MVHNFQVSCKTSSSECSLEPLAFDTPVVLSLVLGEISTLPEGGRPGIHNIGYNVNALLGHSLNDDGLFVILFLWWGPKSTLTIYVPSVLGLL